MSNIAEIRTYTVLFCDCPECGSRLNLEEASVGRQLTHSCGMRAEVTTILNGHSIFLKVVRPAREEADDAVPDGALKRLPDEAPCYVTEKTNAYQISTAVVDPERDTRSILNTIEALVCMNREYLKSNQVPPLLLTGICVSKQPSSESKRPIPLLIGEKTADADELTAWRIAELQERGVRATYRVLWNDRGFPMLLVEHPNGIIEFTSELLEARHQ